MITSADIQQEYLNAKKKKINDTKRDQITDNIWVKVSYKNAKSTIKD